MTGLLLFPLFAAFWLLLHDKLGLIPAEVEA